MVAYEFYCFDDHEPYDVHFLGNPPRKKGGFLEGAPQSILQMGRGVIGTKSQINKPYFIQVEVH